MPKSRLCFKIKIVFEAQDDPIWDVFFPFGNGDPYESPTVLYITL